MDGKGLTMDNIMIERLWRTVKYEEIYLKEYQIVAELKTALKAYFQCYNYEPKDGDDGEASPTGSFKKADRG